MKKERNKIRKAFKKVFTWCSELYEAFWVAVEELWDTSYKESKKDLEIFTEIEADGRILIVEVPIIHENGLDILDFNSMNTRHSNYVI
ncbi:MAG: hypothetical protein HFJ35_00055 [Clostridia bacterium]|nr:hypothetical protein [Clostridia bacterium]